MFDKAKNKSEQIKRSLVPPLVKMKDETMKKSEKKHFNISVLKPISIEDSLHFDTSRQSNFSWRTETTIKS